MEEEQPPQIQETGAAETNATLREKLRDGERHWAWKIGFRSLQILLDIIGIGVTAALAATHSDLVGNELYGFFPLDLWYIPGALTTLSASLAWCLACVLVPLLHRSHHPVVPGAIVGVDLILWLALIVSGLFTIAAIFTLSSYGRGGYIDDIDPTGGQYSGHYIHAANGTWIYKITYVYDQNPTYNYTTGSYTYSTNSKNVKRDCKPYFTSCTEQDNLVNKLWRQKDGFIAEEVISAVAQWAGVLIHFILFIWGCVDTQRRNARDKEDKTQAVAERVIRDMQARGLITVHDPAFNARTAGAQGQGAPLPTEPQMAQAGPSRAPAG